MGKNRYFKSKGMSIALQMAIMKQTYSHFRCVSAKNSVEWTGTIRPTAMSEEYEVRIQYKYGDTPKVWVVRPQIKRRSSEEPIPHIYPSNRLCLYLPGTGQWTRQKSVADTIIPWTALWLYHYEVWHTTGEWLGGGHGTPKCEDEEAE